MADLNSTIVRGNLRVTDDENINGNLKVSGTITGNGSGLTNINYASSAGNADTVGNYHASSFAKIGAHNNLIASGNEFTFVPDKFEGIVWLNYRTVGGTNGNITEYKLGNGAAGELGTIIHTGNIAAQSVNYASTSHFLRTYGATNESHGNDYLLKCRHNVDGDGRFKLQIVRTDGSVTHSTSVDYASSAGSASSVLWDNVTGKPSSYTPSSHTHTAKASTSKASLTPYSMSFSNGVLTITSSQAVEVSLASHTHGVS